MPTRVDTEFTAQPLTYFVRSLGLKSSFHLTTGTFNQIVKDQSRIPPERLAFDFEPVNPAADLSSKPAVSMWPQPLETNLLILARLAAARQLASRATVDLFGTAAALRFWLLAILSASSKRVWHGRPRLCIVAECKPRFS